MSSEAAFEAWGIVDLFGHQRIAGKISEQVIAGETFIRVDIPVGDEFHTRLFGKGAIYSMSISDEEMARGVAKYTAENARPISPYTMRHMIEDQSEDS